MDNWISVKDRLPEAKTEVLLWMKGNPYTKAYSNYDMAVYDPEVYQPFWQYVTHWMPLPEPPGGENS